jgi:hypothetical protein
MAVTTDWNPRLISSWGQHGRSGLRTNFWVSSWSGLSGRAISILRWPLASRSITLQNPYCVTHLGVVGPYGARVLAPFRRSTDQKVGDSSSSGRAADQGFCIDVKCPNRTENCTIVKRRGPSPREIQAGQHFPGFLPPRTHHAPTAHPQGSFRSHRALDLPPYRVADPAPAVPR